MYEFVTITGEPSQIDRSETAKVVRTQAMRDYLRKQNRHGLSDMAEDVTNTKPEMPSEYRGKFKLKSWSHKTKTKAMARRMALLAQKEYPPAPKTSIVPVAHEQTMKIGLWQEAQQQPQTSIFVLSASRPDPFDSLSITLTPRSERLLKHC